MILAAGLGTRLRPLTDLRAKPALPIRGRPVISLLLDFLDRHGCREVMINLHHRSETIRAAVDSDHPADLEISWSEESVPLGTGGGIRRAAHFLSQGEACVVLAGDMLLDIPLTELFDRHVASGRHVTLLLREDPRAEEFGTIGVNSKGLVTRIGQKTMRFDDPQELEGGEKESSCGLFTGVRFFSTQALTDWPGGPSDPNEVADAEEIAFEDLRDWLLPGIESRALRVGAEILDTDSSVWEPVGTLAEYLQVNLTPPRLPSLGGGVEAWTGDVDIRGKNRDVIVSKTASVAPDAKLERCVVWDGEDIPSGFRGRSGVYAGGEFFECPESASGAVH